MNSQAPLADSEMISPDVEPGETPMDVTSMNGSSTTTMASSKEKYGMAAMSAAELQIAKLAKAPWDPMNCPEWDLINPSSQCLQRIRRDLMSLYNDPPHGIFVVPDENNLTIVHALIIGPYDTPYEGGFFYFVIRCPPDYPIRAPKVRLITTGDDTVRFNPNLYRNGKVCLSILGTWSGPSWSPAQSLCSVLVSVQSLLNENPYHNEPGFEKEHHSGDSNRYNQIISHETVRVAVCEPLENSSSGSFKNCPSALLDVMRSSFNQYYEHYVTVCRRLSSLQQGSAMMDPFGEKRGCFDAQSLLKRLERLRSALKCETADDDESAVPIESDDSDDSPPQTAAAVSTSSLRM